MTAATLIGTAAFSPANAFEGKIVSEMTARGHEMEMTYFIKSPQVRMEMQTARKGQSFTSLMNWQTHQMMMLMPEQKMYMSFDVNPDKIPESGDQGASTLQKTGKSKTICGYSCDEYIVTTHRQKIDMWATEGLGRYFGSQNPMRTKGRMPAWTRDMMEKGLYPLEMTEYNGSGRVEMHMVAQSVKEEKLDDSLFKVPNGYKELKMGGMMNMMRNMNPFSHKNRNGD